MIVRDSKLFADMYREVAPKIAGGPWHWFAYHFGQGPSHPFVASIVGACADCERAIPGLGRQLLSDLASISGQVKHLQHWDMLNQKLAEILVLRQLFSLPWPSGSPRFTYEPAGVPDGKRPELLVDETGSSYAFEVKAPAILQHIIDRGSNPTQAPGRVFDRTILRKNQLDKLIGNSIRQLQSGRGIKFSRRPSIAKSEWNLSRASYLQMHAAQHYVKCEKSGAWIDTRILQ